jgi:hypothetical protein
MHACLSHVQHNWLVLVTAHAWLTDGCFERGTKSRLQAQAQLKTP